MIREFADLTIAGASMRLALLSSPGEETPLLFFHGFGSTKEDYADMKLYAPFANRAALAFDAPGCGETECELSNVSMELIATVAERLTEIHGIDRCHIIGHSMGGLAALLFATAHPDKVCSFINIEGNLAPEDCFFSRQIFEYDSEYPEDFLTGFARRLTAGGEFANALYATNFSRKVRAEVVPALFHSIVKLSDEGRLLEQFIDLSCPKMFMFGDANRSLSYISNLAAESVCLSEIPHCGHFPMYSNPPYMWAEIDRFLKGAEAKIAHVQR